MVARPSDRRARAPVSPDRVTRNPPADDRMIVLAVVFPYEQFAIRQSVTSAVHRSCDCALPGMTRAVEVASNCVSVVQGGRLFMISNVARSVRRSL